MIGNIFNGEYLKRLDNIVQWSEKDVFTRESVSQHSYKVTIFCRVLLEEIFGKDKTPQQKEFVLKAVDHSMFHDWDEALLLRDISHETKYNSYNGDEIRKALNNLSEYLSKTEFVDYSNCGSFIYDSLNERDEDVLIFCKFCDWLALGFFIRRESFLGNAGIQYYIPVVNNGLEQSAKKCHDMFLKRFDIDVDIINLCKYV